MPPGRSSKLALRRGSLKRAAADQVSDRRPSCASHRSRPSVWPHNHRRISFGQAHGDASSGTCPSEDRPRRSSGFGSGLRRPRRDGWDWEFGAQKSAALLVAPARNGRRCARRGPCQAAGWCQTVTPPSLHCAAISPRRHQERANRARRVARDRAHQRDVRRDAAGSRTANGGSGARRRGARGIPPAAGQGRSGSPSHGCLPGPRCSDRAAPPAMVVAQRSPADRRGGKRARSRRPGSARSAEETGGTARNIRARHAEFACPLSGGTAT